jgi:hypothetical protein
MADPILPGNVEYTLIHVVDDDLRMSMLDQAAAMTPRVYKPLYRE